MTTGLAMGAGVSRNAVCTRGYKWGWERWWLKSASAMVIPNLCALRVGPEAAPRAASRAAPIDADFLDAAEERAYDAIETIDANELERRVKETLERVQPMREQAHRLVSWVQAKGLKWLQLLGTYLSDRNIRHFYTISTGNGTLTDNDVKVLSNGPDFVPWVWDWLDAEARLKETLKIEKLGIRATRLARSWSYLQVLTRAPKAADYESVDPALTSEVAAKFSFERKVDEFNTLAYWSKGMPLLMFGMGTDNEAIIEIKDPSLEYWRFYDPYTAWAKKNGGDASPLPKDVMDLTEDDVSSTDDVAEEYIEKHYKYAPDHVKEHWSLRPGGSGAQAAAREFRDAAT